MALSKEQLGALIAPINPARVKTFGSNMGTRAGLSYVEAWEIKAALIRVFGYGGFSAEVIDSKIVDVITTETHPGHVRGDGRPKTPQVVAQSTVRLTIPTLAAVYTETAVGSNSGFDIGETADNALKTASSDALKRCATYLGDQFGLSLYDKGNQNSVVRTILDPEQAQILAELREERRAEIEAKQAETQALLDQGTGASDRQGGQG